MILLSACILPAQDSRGRVAGVVTDPAGLPIRNANVAVIHEEMGTRVAASTNDTGNYDLPYLLAGAYRLEADAPGFKKHLRGGLEVRVGDTLTLDVQLEVGGVSQTVTVTEESPLLDAATGSVSSLIDRKMLDDLPLAGNNAMYALALDSGAVLETAPGHNWLPSAVDANSGVSFAGARGAGNDFAMDGISNMSRGNNSFSPPGDMIQEVRIDIANYDASQGRGGGGSVNMAMRSGTNKMRGTLVWDIMPDRFGAVDYFTNARLGQAYGRPVEGEEKHSLVPVRKTNRYQATVGGPVNIPRLYRGANRTFWIYGFQGFNRRAGSNNVFTVPSPQERRGDFSELLNLPADSYVIYDPLTIRPSSATRFTRSPFPGNIVPAERLDPIAQKLLQFYPQPNLPRDSRGFNNYQSSPKNDNDFRQHMGRVDHNFGGKHRLFGRVTQSWLNFRRDDAFFNKARGSNRYRHQWGLALDDVYILSPTLIVNLRAGFTRFSQPDHPFSLGFDLSTLGFSSNLLAQLKGRDYLALPDTSITGYTGLGGGVNSRFVTNYYNLGATVTKLTGGHSIRFGIDHRIFRENSFDYADNAPAFAFAQNWTRGPQDNSASAPLGQSMASFVLGLPTGGGIDTNAAAGLQSRYYGFFVQDDWRVMKRLTLNAGLRWEWDSGPTERYNRAVRGFDPAVANPVQAGAQAAYARNPIEEIAPGDFHTPGVFTFAGVGGQPRNYFGTRKANFAPRIGMAYRLNARTVVRTGYGMFFNPIGIDRSGVIQNGFSVRTSLQASIDTGQTFQATLADPFPFGIQQPAPVGPATWVGRGSNFWRSQRLNPYLQRWSFSVQRQLAGHTMVEAMYMGSRSTHLGATRQVNALPERYWSTTAPLRDSGTISYLTANLPNPFYEIPEFFGTGLGNRNIARQRLLRPFPQYQNVAFSDPAGYSWYHSLQLRGTRRYARGMTVLTSYTWSKNMEATSFLNEFDAMPHRVISDLDRPHRFVASGVFEVPVGRGRKFGRRMRGAANLLLGGWQGQAIYRFQMGAPVYFSDEIPYFGDFASIKLPPGEQRLDRWFNTSDFVLQSGRQLDWNVRRFPLRMSGVRNPHDNWWDLSMFKAFSVTERVKLQLRTNWEGAMNHPQFAAVQTGINNFGRITTTRGEPRRVYVGARLMF
ncbi:MAG: TonB-dependent receptor domain-containing protein [Bryobacteraceae bacterium]